MSKEEAFLAKADDLFSELNDFKENDRISILNSLKVSLHKYSPFATEPVDCVQWIPINEVISNDYNPNVVAPIEMKLLELSINEDG